METPPAPSTFPATPRRRTRCRPGPRSPATSSAGMKTGRPAERRRRHAEQRAGHEPRGKARASSTQCHRRHDQQRFGGTRHSMCHWQRRSAIAEIDAAPMRRRQTRSACKSAEPALAQRDPHVRQSWRRAYCHDLDLRCARLPKRSSALRWRSRADPPLFEEPRRRSPQHFALRGGVKFLYIAAHARTSAKPEIANSRGLAFFSKFTNFGSAIPRCASARAAA